MMKKQSGKYLLRLTRRYLLLILSISASGGIKSQWTQIGDPINGGEDNVLFGRAVATSSNGLIYAVGAPMNNDLGVEAGQVQVYMFDGNDWIQIGQSIDGGGKW